MHMKKYIVSLGKALYYQLYIPHTIISYTCCFELILYNRSNSRLMSSIYFNGIVVLYKNNVNFCLCTEVATVVLNRCRSYRDADNGYYCITYNYEFLDDYKEEEDSGFDDDNLFSLERNGHDDDDDKPG